MEERAMHIRLITSLKDVLASYTNPMLVREQVLEPPSTFELTVITPAPVSPTEPVMASEVEPELVVVVTEPESDVEMTITEVEVVSDVMVVEPAAAPVVLDPMLCSDPEPSCSIDLQDFLDVGVDDFISLFKESPTDVEAEKSGESEDDGVGHGKPHVKLMKFPAYDLQYVREQTMSVYTVAIRRAVSRAGFFHRGRFFTCYYCGLSLNDLPYPDALGVHGAFTPECPHVLLVKCK
jgi:hypothetical protein